MINYIKYLWFLSKSKLSISVLSVYYNFIKRLENHKKAFIIFETQLKLAQERAIWIDAAKKAKHYKFKVEHQYKQSFGNKRTPKNSTVTLK